MSFSGAEQGKMSKFPPDLGPQPDLESLLCHVGGKQVTSDGSSSSVCHCIVGFELLKAAPPLYLMAGLALKAKILWGHFSEEKSLHILVVCGKK